MSSQNEGAQSQCVSLPREEGGWLEGSHCVSFGGRGKSCLRCEHLRRETDRASEIGSTSVRSLEKFLGRLNFLAHRRWGLMECFFPAQSLEKSVDVIKIL